jgi:hypothetical protein
MNFGAISEPELAIKQTWVKYMFQMDITMIFKKLYCIGSVAVFGQIPDLIIAIAFMDYTMTNIQNFQLIKILDFYLIFGRAQNILD